MILYAIIPVMAGVLYALGGNVNKWWRWLMGLPIGGIWFLVTHRYETLLCIATYWIATSAFPYGEKSWLNKYFSEGEKWAICGIVFGLAAFPIIGWWAVLQGIFSGLVFVVVKALDDSGSLKEPYSEFCRAFLGTILL